MGRVGIVILGVVFNVASSLYIICKGKWLEGKKLFRGLEFCFGYEIDNVLLNFF